MSAVIDTDRSSAVKGQSLGARLFENPLEATQRGRLGPRPHPGRAGAVRVRRRERLRAGQRSGHRVEVHAAREGASAGRRQRSTAAATSTSRRRPPARTIEWVDRTDARIGTAGKPEERASANAWSSFDKALIITVSGEDAVRKPPITRNDHGQRRARRAHRDHRRESTATGWSSCRTAARRCSPRTSSSSIDEGAQLTVVTVQEWDNDAIHLASHFATIGRDAKFRHVAVTLGGSLVRLNPTAHLAQRRRERSNCSACTSPTPAQHLEQQVFVNHDAPHTKSRVSYKGALQGAGARTVWVGDVLIRPTAQRRGQLRGEPQPAAHRRRPGRLGPEPGDRDRRHPRGWSRQRQRTIRRRAAVLPAVPRHPGGRCPASRGAGLPLRHPAEDRQPAAPESA